MTKDREAHQLGPTIRMELGWNDPIVAQPLFCKRRKWKTKSHLEWSIMNAYKTLIHLRRVGLIKVRISYYVPWRSGIINLFKIFKTKSRAWIHENVRGGRGVMLVFSSMYWRNLRKLPYLNTEEVKKCRWVQQTTLAKNNTKASAQNEEKAKSWRRASNGWQRVAKDTYSVMTEWALDRTHMRPLDHDWVGPRSHLHTHSSWLSW